MAGTRHKFLTATAALFTGAIFFFTLVGSAYAEPWWGYYLSITQSDWGKPQRSGIVATWDIKVRNASSDTTWKDVHFKTTYWAPSGTQVDESLIGHTEYVAIPPGKTVSIRFREFVHSQAVSGRIIIDGAVIKN